MVEIAKRTFIRRLPTLLSIRAWEHRERLDVRDGKSIAEVQSGTDPNDAKSLENSLPRGAITVDLNYRETLCNRIQNPAHHTSTCNLFVHFHHSRSCAI